MTPDELPPRTTKATSEAVIYLAMIWLLLRRLTQS